MVGSREKLASAKPETCGRHLSTDTRAVTHSVTSGCPEGVEMNRTLAALLVTLAVTTGCSTGPVTESPAAASPSGVSAPTPALTPEPTTPSMSPTPEPTASLVAHTVRPCCTEDDPRFDSMTFAIMAPPSWETLDDDGVDLGVWPAGQGNDPPDGAFVGLYPGGNLFSDPCLTDEEAGADVPVGPTVDDLVTSLVDHPSLDVTAPVDVTLAGYSGMYLDLTIPDDISECARYTPMDHHIYAQGPGQRWHMWILDVNGTRVLVETNDYAGTSAGRLAQEQAIVDSLEIMP
jgi:hypothetical protein